MELLLKHNKVDPCSLDYLALKRASENDHAEIVRMLLKDKRIDRKDPDCLMALEIACNLGNIKTCLVCLEEKLEPYQKCLELAFKKGHVDVVKLLIQDGRLSPTEEMLEFVEGR